MNPLARLGLRARRGFGAFVPDPFVIAIGLTALVMVASGAAAWAGGTRALRVPATVLGWWAQSKGLWSLAAFTMQATLMLIVGHALATAPAIRATLTRAVAIAPGPRALVSLVCLGSIALALLNWSLCLVGGALLATAAGSFARERGWRLHYPLLCAAGYSGLMTWHGGLSGTAPLKATTAAGMHEVLGPQLAARVGAIGLDASLGSPLNLAVSGGLLVLGPLLFFAMTPRDGADPAPHPAPLALEARDSERLHAPAADERDRDLLDRPWLRWGLAAPLLAGFVLVIAERGLARLDLDAVNLGLWGLALAAQPTLRAFLRASEGGARGAAGLVLQFPLYAGVMGMLASSGLSSALAGALAAVGAPLLPLATFLAAGLLNLFVPSGGGQWAIQGPIVVRAALDSGAAPASVLMAVAYGDQWTNMLQPFWALPLLAITGVRARDIVGYGVVWMAAGGLWIAGCLLTLG